MSQRLAFLVLSAFVLMGCETVSSLLPPNDGISPDTYQVEEQASSPGFRAKTNKNDATAQKRVSDPRNLDRDKVAKAVAPVDDNPAQFVGLAGDDIAAALGAPDLTRRDGPAEVRQFRGRNCVLDLFLYPASNHLAVQHVELRGPSLSQSDRRACLAELIRARNVTS